MYNYKLELTYREKDDTQYRKELLLVFGLTEYTDKINQYIDALYKDIKEEVKPVINSLLENDPLTMFSKLDENGCFMILFSWDYFHETHQLIRALLSKNGKKAEYESILLNKIINNKK